MPMSTQPWMQRWGHKLLVSTQYNVAQDETGIREQPNAGCLCSLVRLKTKGGK